MDVEIKRKNRKNYFKLILAYYFLFNALLTMLKDNIHYIQTNKRTIKYF